MIVRATEELYVFLQRARTHHTTASAGKSLRHLVTTIIKVSLERIGPYRTRSIISPCEKPVRWDSPTKFLLTKLTTVDHWAG